MVHKRGKRDGQRRDEKRDDNRSRARSLARPPARSHFTSTAVLEAVTALLLPRLRAGDLVVDCSAGANEWLHLVKARVKHTLADVRFRGYDIFPAPLSLHLRIKDWFRVSLADLFQGARDGERDRRGAGVVVGLNPPFGVDGRHASRFVEHAMRRLAPRLLALIVPPGTDLLLRPLAAARGTAGGGAGAGAAAAAAAAAGAGAGAAAATLPAGPACGYEVVLFDDAACASTRGARAFYLPGSYDAATRGAKEDWNKEAPPFVVLQRRDPLPRGFEPPPVPDWVADSRGGGGGGGGGGAGAGAGVGAGAGAGGGGGGGERAAGGGAGAQQQQQWRRG